MSLSLALRRSQGGNLFGHPLKGFIFGIDGQALTPTYTNKSQKSANGTKARRRYRYYISQQAIRQGYGSPTMHARDGDAAARSWWWVQS